MKFLHLIFLSIISFSLFSADGEFRKITFEDRVYDPFFAATIIDNEGSEAFISRVSFYDEFNDKKFFFWVRRNSGLYNISFKNIKKIVFVEDSLSDSKYKNFSECELTLVTGEVFDMYLKSTGHIDGWDKTFGSPVSFYLHYNLINSITFHHDGEYKICPFCSTIYFDVKTERCIYDKTPLVEGVLSESSK